MIYKQQFIGNIVFEKYCLRISEYSKDRISKQGVLHQLRGLYRHFSTLMWTKFGFLWTTYPFHLAYLVFEWHPEVQLRYPKNDFIFNLNFNDKMENLWTVWISCKINQHYSTPEKMSWGNAHLNLCKLLETELRLAQRITQLL